MRLVPLFRRALAALAITFALAGASLISSAGGSTVGASSAIPGGQSPISEGLANGNIRPLSASTCSGAVCIYVTGTGLNVSSWETTLDLTRSTCSTPYFLANGLIIHTGSQLCGTSGKVLDWTWPSPGNFPNGTVLCNSWTGSSGEPCVTVHS
jgi:hypothetical protein